MDKVATVLYVIAAVVALAGIVGWITFEQAVLGVLGFVALAKAVM